MLLIFEFYDFQPGCHKTVGIMGSHGISDREDEGDIAQRNVAGMIDNSSRAGGNDCVADGDIGHRHLRQTFYENCAGGICADYVLDMYVAKTGSVGRDGFGLDIAGISDFLLIITIKKDSLVGYVTHDDILDPDVADKAATVAAALDAYAGVGVDETAVAHHDVFHATAGV